MIEFNPRGSFDKDNLMVPRFIFKMSEMKQKVEGDKNKSD